MRREGVFMRVWGYFATGMRNSLTVPLMSMVRVKWVILRRDSTLIVPG